MPLIQWRDEFEIGIDEIDHEHRELISLINEADAALQDDADIVSIASFFGEIYTRISAHFALEEAVMRRLRYDGYGAHKADHEELLEGIRDIMDGYERGEYTKYHDVLAEHLESWFTTHFGTKDASLHHFIHTHDAT